MKLRSAIQNRGRELPSEGAAFLHDNARTYTANVTKQLLREFQRNYRKAPWKRNGNQWNESTLYPKRSLSLSKY